MRDLYLRFHHRLCSTALVSWLAFTLIAGSSSAHPTRSPTLPILDRSAACAEASWIGVLKEEAAVRLEAHRKVGDKKGPVESVRSVCPRGWKPVFTSSLRPPQPVPPGLRRFCAYEGDPRRDTTISGGFAEYEYPLFFESIEQDCLIVGPAAESFFVPGTFGAALRQRFIQEARGIPPNPMPGGSAGAVRLTIIDSVQDDLTPEKRACKADPKPGDRECSPHGEILVKLARDLLCANGNCAAEITTRRVLRSTYFIQAAAGATPVPDRLHNRDASGEVQGGFSGSTEDLATAIRREVEGWWAEGNARPKLILNLSVGWESIHAADSPLVKTAIQDAVCRGALVIAAAGNRVAGPASLNTPLLPAAWEQEAAPTAARCQELLEDSAQPQTVPKNIYTPLLYAVGGVQQDNRLLSTARPSSTPRLVAFGDHASAIYPGSFPRHETLTGTSVSTLVVSAAAAVRWSKNPGRTSFELMEELWQANKNNIVVPAVDFCLDPRTNCPPPARARRIYIYDEPEEDAKLWPGGLPPTDDAAITAVAAFSNLFTAVADVADCNPRELNSFVNLPDEAELCPQRLYDVAVLPALGPQPGSNHNPDCEFTTDSPGTLLLQFDRRYRVQGVPVELSDFTLLANGKAFRLSNEKFLLGQPNSGIRQIVLGDLPFEDPHPLYLAATVNGEYATITPLLVVKKDSP